MKLANPYSRRDFVALSVAGPLVGWMPWFRPKEIALGDARFRIVRNHRSTRRYVLLEGDQDAARQVLLHHMESQRGTAYLIEGSTREVQIAGGKLDPNRMFSRAGAEDSLRSLNPAWNEVQQNDLGIDDYMVLNKLLNLEPYICVNAGFGDAHSAAEEVEYVSGSATTPMGKWRAANGHPEPYKVTWWNIGNEMWNPQQMGFMSVDHYWIKHNMFAQAMRRVDPNIKIVTSGASFVETSQSHAALAITGKHIAAIGGPADFTFALLAHSSDYFDAAAEHIYPSPADQAFDAGKQDYVKVEEPLVGYARKIANGVRCVVEAWAEYQRRFPALNMDRYPVALDEWVSEWIGERGTNPPGNSMFAPLACSQAMHEMFNHSNRFIMSSYTGASSLLAINKTDATVRPIGLMFEMYRRHFGTIPVEVTGNSPQHEVKGTVWVDKPKVTSGSDTYPLDAAAALTADRKTLTVAITNPTESEQQIDVAIQGVTVQDKGRLWRIAGADLTADNQPGKPLVVDIVGSPLTGVPGRLTVPKLSMSIYELPLR